MGKKIFEWLEVKAKDHQQVLSPLLNVFETNLKNVLFYKFLSRFVYSNNKNIDRFQFAAYIQQETYRYRAFHTFLVFFSFP
jgi:hypothetical protein